MLINRETRAKMQEYNISGLVKLVVMVLPFLGARQRLMTARFSL